VVTIESIIEDIAQFLNLDSLSVRERNVYRNGQTTPYGGTEIPNGDHLPYYAQVNVGLSHAFRVGGDHDLTARLDVINALDRVYQIRNGTGVGVGAPQFGPRRGFFGGLAIQF
jgi:outer membrane receptor for Fe3+-dicitrate